MTISTLVIFLCGLSWLNIIFGNNNVLEVGLYPYLPGAVIKIALATVLFRLGWRVIDKFDRDEERQ